MDKIKVIAIIFLIIILINFLLFIFNVINPLPFWITIVFCALAAYVLIPRMKKV